MNIDTNPIDFLDDEPEIKIVTSGRAFGKRIASLQRFITRIECGQEDLLIGSKFVAMSTDMYNKIVNEKDQRVDAIRSAIQVLQHSIK